MSVKIINILKDDSFNDILELFRKAPAGEVILVLPRVGKLFKHEDHFAAFASEANQGNKTVSILTANPQIAHMAREFGFTVMASNSAPTRSKAKAKKMVAKLASQPPPEDETPSDDESMPQSDADNDVPLTSDEVEGTTPPEDETDPLQNMRIFDIEEEGQKSAVDKDEPFADLTAAAVDGVRGGIAQRRMSPTAKAEKAAPVPVQGGGDLDYIDAMWRAKIGRQPVRSSGRSAPNLLPSFLVTSMPRKMAVGILVAAMLVLGGVVYAMTGSAHVTVIPVSTPVDTEIAVQASDVFTSVDDTFGKLPGQLLDVSKTASNTVTATGQRDVASKARGTLTVSNLYSSTPQTLVATTRFQSADGKVFRTLQTITVPGSTVKSGAAVPGTANVEVIADKPGPDYNVPAGKFVIMAFKEKGDTQKAEQLYGTATAAMTGGASGPSSVVTQENYDAAKDAAMAAVKEQIKSALAAQGPSLSVINADTPAFKDVQSTARADDAADAVTVTATGTLKTIAFRQADLLELIRTTLLKKDRVTVLPDTLTLAYTDIVFKPDMGTLSFTVSVQGTGYTPVDTDTIKKDISGKNSQQIHDYFDGREGIQSATVTLSPFWVRSVPKDTAKTSITLQYGQQGQETR